MLKKSLAVILGLTLLVSLLAGCSPKAATSGGSAAASPAASTAAKPSQAPSKSSVKMVISSDMQTFDPHNSPSLVDQVVRNNIFEALLDYYQGKFTPVLCDSVDATPDGLSYTVKLKKGIKFQNGDELKAADVIYSLQRAQQSTQFKSVCTNIDTISSPDDYTVVIKMKQVDAAFQLCVLSEVQIISQKVTSAAGYDIKANPVGTGPYKLVKWDAGQQIVLTRFDDYHGGAVPIKDATYTIITDATSAQMALQSKEVDLTYSVPSIAVAQLAKDPKLTVQKVRTLGSGYVVYNLEKGPFKDQNFRIALNYALDKQSVIDVAMDGNGEVSTGLWNKDTVGYTNNVPTYTYDLAKAKDALSKSTYKGETISFKVKDDGMYKKIAVLAQENLRKIGINLDVTTVESNAWISDMQKGNYDMSFIIMTMDADAAKWATALTSSAVGVLNFSRLSNPEVDKAFNNAVSTLDISQRNKYYDQVAQYIKDQAVVIPLFYRTMVPVYQKALTVSKFYQTGYALVKDMSWS